MSDNQLQLRVTDGTRASTSGERAPSIVQRIVGSQMTSHPIPQPPSRLWLGIVILVLAVSMAAVWTFVTRSQLSSAVRDQTSQQLLLARKAFDALRTQTQTNLSAHCRVLVEDPRLKATLATEGMDPATVADILQDLAKLRRAGFLLVLSPEGRVFAQAGASELEGLDLSSSAVVKKAKDTDDASVGSWVLAGKVMDLSIKSIRYGESLVAYLVVGQPIDEAQLAGVADQTGVAIASALANKVVLTSSKDPLLADVFAHVANETAGAAPHVVTSNGLRYLASAVELPETSQSHRLVLVSSLDTVAQRFRVVEWLVFAPPVLVLLAVLFVLSAIRSPRRIT
jgi:type II secretory pathway pseudopilin PulG